MRPPREQAMTAATQPLAAGDTVGKYTVIRPLGQGGMGMVFEVKHQTLGTRAALKLLWTGQAINRELAARFLTEARAGGAIEHPGVVRVLEYDVLPSGLPYLLMEFLPGETLSQRLYKSRKLGLAALPILQQIADTLAAVHARGIVHRAPPKSQKPSRNRDLMKAEKPLGKLRKSRDLRLVLDGREQRRALLGAHAA